ncbi:MAG: hypothetical protein HQL07_07410 [Nitrospirae bacterium]|nr:hypothetical protein [Magnetococcales bacterium]HAT49542.1 hypothetical protein [Alphaproteobacteria bacterium]
MNNPPLLVFPKPRSVAYRKDRGGGNASHYPSRERQAERLAPKFKRLQEALQSKSARSQMDMDGANLEQVLVLETIGGVDAFIGAVREVKGLEWLGEMEVNDISPDEDFYHSEENPEKLLRGRLFLVMSDQLALKQMLSLWKHWKKSGKDGLEHSFTKFCWMGYL